MSLRGLSCGDYVIKWFKCRGFCHYLISRLKKFGGFCQRGLLSQGILTQYRYRLLAFYRNSSHLKTTYEFQNLPLVK